ncbi:ROK family protein [Pasteurellaceae bacterium USgator11]|nr:ROK family protein [Pasteurellaceae bacterium UScroc12]TNG94732.1 ROK family protein [Pasteurellaceae bacterium USgator41]TNG97703.1 ROK family protein [Pasteurellaceae bacterium UScroc31]TNH01664.1 ROK family protein [Pasteurellaceae bacterium USgator11]
MNQQIQIVNVDFVKQANGALVYRLIDQLGPISRIQVSEMSGLAAASVTKITRNLLRLGLIKEVAQQQSTGGRRATSIVAERQNFVCLLIRLGRTSVTIAAMNLATEVLFKRKYQLQTEQTVEQLEQYLLQHIRRSLSELQQNDYQIIACGITVPGFVDQKSNTIRFMPQLNLQKPWKLAESIQQLIQLPVFIGHDVRALALAESYFGKTRETSDSLLLRIHRGVAAGIILNRELFSGSKNNLGEIGHTQVDPLGKRCKCGNFGCLETLVSNQAIEDSVRELLQQGHHCDGVTLQNCNLDTICAAVNQGDPLLVELFQRLGKYIGQVLAVCINVLNPEKIILSGQITQAQQVLFPAIEKALQAMALSDFVQNTALEASELAHDDIIGAFALIKRALWNGELLVQLLED